MTRRAWVGFIGVGLVAIAAGTAHAAPPWSEPRPVGIAEPAVADATIAFGPDGAALLSRRTTRTGAGQTQVDTDRLATLMPDGRVVEGGSLPDRLAAPPQVFGDGRVALLRATALSKPGAIPRRLRLRLSLGTVHKPLPGGRPRRVATYTAFPSDAASGPAMAIGPRGEIAVVWMAFRGDEFGSGRFRVRLALRRPNGRFERTRTVAAGRVVGDRNSYSVAAAFGARRDLVVAYALDPLDRPRRAASITARTLRRGRRFDRPQALGTQDGLVELAARASRTGRTIIAWATQDSGEEANRPYVVRAAIRSPRARRFGATRVLDPGEFHDRSPGRMRLAMGRDGTAAVVWSSPTGQFPAVGYPVRVAVAEAGGAFGPVSQLATNGSSGDVAVRDDGAVLVAWTNTINGPLPAEGPQTLAALRASAGQPLGPPESVSSSPSRYQHYVAAAFDPRSGIPAVVWTTGEPGGVSPEQMLLAGRTG